MIAHDDTSCRQHVLLSPRTTDGPAIRARQEQGRPDLAGLLGQFAPINLAEMDSVALQDRTDTKYVFHARHLYPTLAALTERYHVLEIDGLRLQRYHTLYFDTTNFALYYHHHAGRRNRYKVRSRQYVDTDLSCLEVKFKTNADRTIKSRLRTPGLVSQLNAETSAFVRAHLPSGTEGLTPQLSNNFTRITLVSKVRHERLTLDVSLCFANEQRTIALPEIVIAEVKQAGHGHASDFTRLMREQHLPRMSFSKYCIGVSLLYPNLKHNNFKAHHRLLAKLRGEATSDLD